MKKNKSVLLDRPIIYRKQIIKKAMIESGLILEPDNLVFDNFWTKYQELLFDFRDCIIFD